MDIFKSIMWSHRLNHFKNCKWFLGEQSSMSLLPHNLNPASFPRPLIHVDGFTIIFKAPQRQRCVEITENEFPRFSHQIPAVRGEMNGCVWDLDPASVPGAFPGASSG